MSSTGLAPEWMDSLLTAEFFKSCRSHYNTSSRTECNIFCVACPEYDAICAYCRSSDHNGHRTLQIRRSSYQNVVKIVDIRNLLDITGVQLYTINGAHVVFLNERRNPRPQGRPGPSSSSSSSTITATARSSSVIVTATGAGTQPHICEVCSRTLLDEYRFCSLGCKFERIKTVGDSCLVVDEEERSDDIYVTDGDGRSSATRRRQRRQYMEAQERERQLELEHEQEHEREREREREAAAPGGGGGGGGGEGGGDTVISSEPVPEPAPSASKRKRPRKGIPRRAPYF